MSESGRNGEARGARLALSLSGTNLARAGDYNQRVVLQAVRQRGETTRIELADLTGLTPPTIANITRRLEQDGLIRHIGRIAQGRGQPALRLAIDPNGAFAIGVNIDRDHLSLACIDLAGTLRASHSREITYPSPDQTRGFIAEAIVDVRARAGIDPARIIGAGIALPDQMSRAGFHDRPAAFAVWEDIDLAALVADILPWPLHIDNDAAAAALAELHLGAGPPCTDFFYLLINAGLGGGLVLDGSFYRGASGRSGEIAFIPGRSGPSMGKMVEARVSLYALYARLDEAGLDSGTLAALDAMAARSVIAVWIDEAVEALIDPLIAVDCLLDPEAILIGGRLPAAIIDTLATRLGDRLAAHIPPLPTLAAVRRATMPDIAPAIGAALLPFSDRLLPSDSILMTVARG